MTIERTEGNGAKISNKAGRLFGSLKDALVAASKDEMPAVRSPQNLQAAPAPKIEILPPPLDAVAAEVSPRVARPKAEDVAPEQSRHVAAAPAEPPSETDAPPTTRVFRAKPVSTPEPDDDRTVLVRGKQKIRRGKFEQDPVVGFLVVVGGPGLGQFRPVFEGNNTIGRTTANRVAFDFGDDSISAEAQAYIRYDSTDRSFLFVPNLAKTNVVSVNDKRPTSAVTLQAMDVITLGRTQVAFMPFCGQDFDWAEITED